MNTTINTTIKEKFIPVIIKFYNSYFISFININECDTSITQYYKPTKYYKLESISRYSNFFKEIDFPLQRDVISKMTLTQYFQASCIFKEKNIIYNLKKFKHELNNK